MSNFPQCSLAAILMIFLTTPMTLAEDNSAEKKRPVVIVHGAWGGGHQWKPVARSLEKEHGGPVYRVTLTGHGERSHLVSRDVNLSTHIEDVVNLISFESLDSVILIGHSYGGMVISGVADSIPERLSQLIYLDAIVLENGESYLSLMPDKQKKYTVLANTGGDGWLIPVEWENKTRDVPHQLATLKQPLSLTNPKRLQIPSQYWLFADAAAVEKDDQFIFLNRAKKLNWPTRTMDWSHNPHVHRPKELAAELLKAFQQ